MTVKNIVYTGLLMALTIVATFINIRIPLGGAEGALMHFGTTVSVISVLVFGKKTGTISGSVGMSLFDLIGGWATWIPGTFIARLGLGYILGQCSYTKDNKLRGIQYQLLGLLLGGIFMCFIYYLWEAFLYKNFITPIGSIPANVIQVVAAYVIGIPISILLNKSIHVEKY